jgi:hypothetical protein
MNLAWITALNVFVLLDKIIPWRFWVAKITGRPVDQSFHAAPESIHFPYYERIGLAQLGQSLIHSTFAISQVVRLRRL